MTRERIAAAVIVIVGAVLRLVHLTLKPLHHDEGVNGFFMTNLYRGGAQAYKYDPQNYHGPSLYFLDWPFLKLFGLETIGLRLMPALFGIGVIILVLLLGRRLGRNAALAAAALVAVSPGMVFISRYFIHEMMVEFFMLGIIVSVLYYFERFQAVFIFLAAASAGFLVATKETALPSMIVMLIAAGMTWGVMRWTSVMRLAAQTEREGRESRASRKKKRKEYAEEPAEPDTEREKLDVAELPHQNVALLMWALVVFVAINAVLFSSFYTNNKGLLDAVRSLMFWVSTGNTAHTHPRWQFAAWMTYQESGAFYLGWLGILVAMWRRDHALPVFLGFWALGQFSMYSLIPYKTPWLQVNIVLPFAIMGGYFVQMVPYLGRPLDEPYSDMWRRTSGTALLVMALGIGAYQCYVLNFVQYDNNDDAYVYVYAHTVRDVERMLHDIDVMAGRAQGLDTKIPIVSQDYWPLPWYLRFYKNALFFGHMADLNDAPLAVASPDEELQVRQRSGGTMRPVGIYDLRPGVKLVLWARSSLGGL